MAAAKPKSDTFNKNTADYLKQYLTYMKLEKNCSPSTLYSYRTELERLNLHMGRGGTFINIPF